MAYHVRGNGIHPARQEIMVRFNVSICYGRDETPIRWFSMPVKWRDIDEAVEWVNETFEDGVVASILDAHGVAIERFTVPKQPDDIESDDGLPRYPWLNKDEESDD